MLVEDRPTFDPLPNPPSRDPTEMGGFDGLIATSFFRRYAELRKGFYAPPYLMA